MYAECTLPLDTLAIRVLDLLPGNETDHLRGSLRVLQLSNSPSSPYECVSYVWGDPHVRDTAIINERPVSIRRNLYNSLCQIRSPTRPIAIWADALCINQADLDEKSRQVALMVEIYRQCAKVHIWLGKPELAMSGRNPFRFLHHWISGRHFYELPGFYYDNASGLWFWNQNEECDMMLNDFLQIVRSEWWTRAWTVQESLLPRESIVMFGTWTITWDFMLKAEEMKNSHGDGSIQCCKQAMKAFNPQQRGLIEEWMWHPSRGKRFMDVFRDRIWQPNFYEAVLAFSGRQCEDQRDKIYSMLSLATHPVYKDFGPDYLTEPSKMYKEVFTRMLLEAGWDFRCLMGGGFGSSMPGLPSWVKDFSHPRPFGVVPIEERRMWYDSLYRASSTSIQQMRICENQELHYEGTYVDTVRAVGKEIGATETVLGENLLSKILHQWLDLCKEATGVLESNELRKTFYRIICADVCKQLGQGPEFRRATNADFPQEEDVWEQLLEGNLEALGMDGYGWGDSFGAGGRAFFTTVSGKMGLCQANTMPSDEIWTLAGARVPFALRAGRIAEARHTDKYLFVGDCFFDGIMDGELYQREQSMQKPLVLV